METKTVNLYTIEELRELFPSAYARVLEAERESARETWEADFIFDEFIEDMQGKYSFDFNTKTVKLYGGGTKQKEEIYFSGFNSQGDGASFFGSMEHSAIVELIEKEGKAEEYKALLAYCKETMEGMNFSVVSSNSRYCHEQTMIGSLDVDLYDCRGSEKEEADKLESYLIEKMRGEAQDLYSKLEKDYEWAGNEENALEMLREEGAAWNEEGRRV